MRIAHVVLGVVITALGVFALFAASDLDVFGEHGVPGPGFFPDVLAAALAVLGVLLTVVSVIRIRRGVALPGGNVAAVTAEAASSDAAADVTEHVDPKGMRRVAKVWLGFVVSIPLLFLIGFVPAMVLLVAYLTFAVERLRGVRPVLATVLIPLAAYAVFAYLLDVDLPLGGLFGQS